MVHDTIHLYYRCETNHVSGLIITVEIVEFEEAVVLVLMGLEQKLMFIRDLSLTKIGSLLILLQPQNLLFFSWNSTKLQNLG